jgi:predicted RNA-binding Zn ribbon-like protein
MTPEQPISGLTSWYWLGGRPALDFVNTRRERWRRDVECLLSVEDVVVWLVRARLLPQPMKAPASVLAEARELREAIDAGVCAAVASRPPDVAAVALIDDWLALAGSRPALLTDPIGRAVLSERPRAESPRRALGMVAYDAARMLGIEAERARVRICASDILRPLAGGAPALVLDDHLRQPGEGPAVPGALSPVAPWRGCRAARLRPPPTTWPGGAAADRRGARSRSASTHPSR